MEDGGSSGAFVLLIQTRVSQTDTKTPGATASAARRSHGKHPRGSAAGAAEVVNIRAFFFFLSFFA